jgi:hypothetical protein
MAGYHQFHAVKAAIDEAIRATAKDRAAERLALTGPAEWKVAKKAIAASA